MALAPSSTETLRVQQPTTSEPATRDGPNLDYLERVSNNSAIANQTVVMMEKLSAASARRGLTPAYAKRVKNATGRADLLLQNFTSHELLNLSRLVESCHIESSLKELEQLTTTVKARLGV